MQLMGKRGKIHEEKEIKNRTGKFLKYYKSADTQCRHLSAWLTTVRRYLLHIQNAGHMLQSLQGHGNPGQFL